MAIARSKRRWAGAGIAESGPDASPDERTQSDPTSEANRNDKRLQSLLDAVGARYRNCTLNSFRCDAPAQRHAVEQLRQYVDDWADRRRHGHGIMAIGGVGGGKDHLLIATARELIQQHGVTVRWVSGPKLFSGSRANMGANEEKWIGQYVYAPLLILSDPLPPRGGLTDHQAATVQLIVDERYRAQRPTWATINVADSREADERMGASIVDRLSDGALIVRCNWRSYRKPLAP